MSKTTATLTVPPNHWSRKEADGLAQFEEYDPVTQETRYWRAPWKDNQPHLGGTGVPQAQFHGHSAACRKPIRELTEENVERSDLAWSKQLGGSTMTYSGRTSDTWCTALRIPIFAREAEVPA